MATLSVIAGPNRSGKSTLTSSMTFEGHANLIDADAIARRINPNHPARSAIAAAREAIVRCKSLLSTNESFVLETTLAGNGAISLIKEARQRGYKIYLVYVSLGDPDLHIEHVRLRVAQGGHDIPEPDIRRRYTRSLRQAPKALRLADEAVVLDNSGLQPFRVLSLRGGLIVWQGERIPAWGQDLKERLG